MRPDVGIGPRVSPDRPSDAPTGTIEYLLLVAIGLLVAVSEVAVVTRAVGTLLNELPRAAPHASPLQPTSEVGATDAPFRPDGISPPDLALIVESGPAD